MNDSNQELIPAGNTPLVSLGTMQADDAIGLVSSATVIAKQLKSVVTQAKLAVSIQGREYVKVEGWTTLGMLLGCIPREVETREMPEGRYVATVAFYKADGTIVTQASAECGGPDDTVWSKRQPFAVRSMAQTRATGKAARLAFSWIMSLAGYAPTPAEEMEDAVARPTGGSAETHPSASRPCTAKQAGMLCGIIARKSQEGGPTLTEFCKEFSVESVETLPIDKVNDALAWLNAA